MVYDLTTYNGEVDLLEMRLNMLNDFVDEFIVCECPVTFSGNPKPLYFEIHQSFFEEWMHKIKYFVIDTNWTGEEMLQAKNSPATQYGKFHWFMEFLQKESIKKSLEGLNDEDLVFVGDVDEIWTPEAMKIEGQKLKLKVYTYYLNNRSDEQFWGGLFLRYKDIKGKCLNDIRNFSPKTEKEYGWHFTSLANMLERKLLDGYTKDTYATDAVMNSLKDNVKNNKDFLGRNFTFKVDESNWPQYLKDNREKYKNLLKEPESAIINPHELAK